MGCAIFYPQQYSGVYPVHQSQQHPHSRPRITGGSLLALLIFTALPVYGQLIVSEIYRDPPGTEGSLGGGASHEFVELTNLGSDSVALDRLFITNGLEADSIVPMREPLTGHESCLYNAGSIPPGATALLLDSDYRAGRLHDPVQPGLYRTPSERL